jgi:hypothetical protein
MSGLAITAFVLSIVCGLIALVGLWLGELVPIALAALGLRGISRTGKRGRLLAIFAIIMAVAFGSCSYFVHTKGMEMFTRIPESLLAALSAKTSAADRDAELEKWAWPEKLKKQPDLVASWRANYARAVKEYGAYEGSLDVGIPWLGLSVLFIEPKHGKEIGATGETPKWSAGSVIWVPARFEKGRVYVAVVLQDGSADAMKNLRKESSAGGGAGGFDTNAPVAIVGDVRFFAPKP